MSNLANEAAQFWTAFLAAQKKMDTARKNKTNPHLKNKYADLGSVIDEVKAPLNDAGLVYTQQPESISNGVIRIRTRVVHSTTGCVGIDATTEIPCGADAQKVGSAITYAKRYALQAVCGIPSEDDDGHAAANPRKLQAPPSSGDIETQLRKTTEYTQALQDAKSIDQLNSAWKAIPEEMRGTFKATAAECKRKLVEKQRAVEGAA